MNHLMLCLLVLSHIPGREPNITEQPQGYFISDWVPLWSAPDAEVIAGIRQWAEAQERERRRREIEKFMDEIHRKNGAWFDELFKNGFDLPPHC